MNNQTIEDHLENVTKDITQFTSNRNQVNLRMDKLNGSIEELNKKINKYGKGIRGFFHTQYQNVFGNSKTKEKLAGIKVELEPLQRDLEKAKLQKEIIEKRLDQANFEKERLVKLNDISKGMTSKIVDINNRISRKNEKLKGWRDRYYDPSPSKSISKKGIEDQIDRTKGEISNLKNYLKKISDNLKDLKPTIDRLENDRQSLRNQFNSSLNETTKAYNLTPDKLNEIANKIERVNKELNNNLEKNGLSSHRLLSDKLIEEINKDQLNAQSPPSYENAHLFSKKPEITQALPSYEQATSVARRSSLNERRQSATALSNLRNSNISRSPSQTSIERRQQSL